MQLSLDQGKISLQFLMKTKTGLALYILPGGASKEAGEKNLLVEENQSTEANVNSVWGPMQFMFESEVDRIFTTPLGALKIIWSPTILGSCWKYLVPYDVLI